MQIKLTEEILENFKTYKEKQEEFRLAKQEMEIHDTNNNRQNFDYRRDRMLHWERKISQQLFELLEKSIK